LIFWESRPEGEIGLSSFAANRLTRKRALAPGVGYLTGSNGATDRPAPALIRIQARGPIVNTWLVVIALVGTMITVADGLTRVSLLEREEAWKGPLAYEPYGGALLLAGISFPLMMAYARKARISPSEGLFLWFVFCTAAYTRDFAYLHWPGTPFFVTDVVLLILLLSIYISRRPGHTRDVSPVSVLLILFLGAGALSATRGFWGLRGTMVVLRDSALVVYALFLLVGYHLFRSWLSIKRVGAWFLLGTVLSALNGVAWFFAVPEERRFIYHGGIYILISLTGTVVATANGLLRPRVGLIFVCILCLGLMLANARSLFVSLAVLFFLGLLGGTSIYQRIRRAHVVSTVIAASVLVALVTFLFLCTRAGRDFEERSAKELASGVLNSDEDPTWQFRLFAWKGAWKRFGEYPLAGEGFGVPFTIEELPFDNDPRPHNTFLTVLYKMGLCGFLPLAALLIYVLRCGLRSIHRHRRSHRIALLEIVVGTQTAFCLYGLANLLIESPFLASLFWMSMGLSLRIMRMLDAERSLQWSFPGETR